MNLRDNLNWIDAHKNKHWMGFNETCAYLHADIADAPKASLGIVLRYDGHYCNFFEKKPSFWTLELSDRLREAQGKTASVRVDGRKTKIHLGPKQVVQIPAGLGTHRIDVH